MIEDDGLPSAFTTAHELGTQGSQGGGGEGRAPFCSLWVCSAQGWTFVFFPSRPCSRGSLFWVGLPHGSPMPWPPLRPLVSPAGHVFNMPHDNVKVCEEVFGKLRGNHMMSPTLIRIDRANPWSACSAAIVTDFLDSGHGERGWGGGPHGPSVFCYPPHSRPEEPGSGGARSVSLAASSPCIRDPALAMAAFLGPSLMNILGSRRRLPPGPAQQARLPA